MITKITKVLFINKDENINESKELNDKLLFKEIRILQPI